MKPALDDKNGLLTCVFRFWLDPREIVGVVAGPSTLEDRPLLVQGLVHVLVKPAYGCRAQ